MTCSAYRGWDVSPGIWPVPAWTATAPDYNASHEGFVHADTYEDLTAKIDAWIEEHEA